MNKKIQICFLFILYIFSNSCFANDIDIINKKKFDIIATVNEFAITKYDLENILKITTPNITKRTNKIFNDSLEGYINLIQQRIIATNSKISINENEKTNLWKFFSMNSNIKSNMNIDTYCRNNSINKDILLFFLESNYLWLKYIETNIKPTIRVGDNYINDVLEYNNINNKITKYNLAEIVLNYNNKEQKNITIKKINEIYKKLNSKNFESIAFSMSQSPSSKNNGLIGWINEQELNNEIILNIKDIPVNGFSRPFCIGDIVGACLIIKINDKNIENIQNSNIENEAKQYIFNQMLEAKIKDILNSNKNKINVIYR